MIGGISADMNFIESIVFGLISGLSDVLPVSAQGHKAMVLKVFGQHSEDPLMRLLIHGAILAALYYSCSQHIVKISRQLRLSRIPKKKRKRPLDTQLLMEFRLLRVMVIPAVLSLLMYTSTAQWGTRLNVTALFLFLNAVILYLPNLLPTGNKDARSLSPLEGVLMGIGGGLSVLPGISSVGGALSVASACGVERNFALSMTYLMHMVLTVGLILFDFAALFGAGLSAITGTALLNGILAAAAAFGGTYLGIRIMRTLAVNIGFSVFALYSAGAALLSFMLYLMV